MDQFQGELAVLWSAGVKTVIVERVQVGTFGLWSSIPLWTAAVTRCHLNLAIHSEDAATMWNVGIAPPSKKKMPHAVIVKIILNKGFS